ncbi:hypothetical protein DSLASN_40770 [Desulfoluna limicola]|uniref:Uncharacterized protein n=1 Tax=Desulfoluna limicola TaxID=2810562 RepID=A0ABM7PLY4_9BACT|nr:hypothetical protein DSLASN_40770 [Desulfoluna limicola]
MFLEEVWGQVAGRWCKGKESKLPPAARCATLKAGSGCALPLVPRVKSHPPLKRNSFKGTIHDLFVTPTNVWPPAGLPHTHAEW